MGHTWGPWQWHIDGANWRRLTGYSGDVLFVKRGGQRRGTDVSKADMALIAAAPDLLAALEGLLSCPLPPAVGSHVQLANAQSNARSAIAKARGTA